MATISASTSEPPAVSRACTFTYTSSRDIPATWPTLAAVSAAYWLAARQHHIEARRRHVRLAIYGGETMARYLKRGMDASAIKAADAKVRETVESILAEVEERKDAAIREFSEKFDKWSPKDFHLSPSEVERAIAQVPKRDIEDIKF